MVLSWVTGCDQQSRNDSNSSQTTWRVLPTKTMFNKSGSGIDSPFASSEDKKRAKQQQNTYYIRRGY